MNIWTYFQNKGIDVINRTFYAKIDEWNSWYIGNVKKFSRYRIYTGQGSHVTKKRYSLGAAKLVCEDISDLLMNEKVKITVEDDSANEFVHKVFDNTGFTFLVNEYQERKAATGTVAYVPYFYDMDITENGEILNAKIGMNFYTANHIYPVSWTNGVITECIFESIKTEKQKKYIWLQYHKLENGLYVIENTIIENQTGCSGGRELNENEWQQLNNFKNLAARVETGNAEPQFVIDKLNIVNNADEDESNPMGIAIFANAIDVLKKIDLEYDSYKNEFDAGRKRILVSPEVMKYKDGSPAFDPDDTVFYKLPEDYAGDDDNGLIKEIDMNLRVEEHSRAINDDLNYLSLKCGFGTGRYRFENGGLTTATEVISVNSDMYRRLKKHEIILENVIKKLVKIILHMGNVLGMGFDEESKVVIDFDDSIIEDKQTERNTDRADVAMGAMQLWEYRAKWKAETEEQAKAAVVQESDIIE